MFQDRPGTEPQDVGTGSVAADYDMVFAFKTLPIWWKATGPANLPIPFTERLVHLDPLPPKRLNDCSGAPLNENLKK